MRSGVGASAPRSERAAGGALGAAACVRRAGAEARQAAHLDVGPGQQVRAQRRHGARLARRGGVAAVRRVLRRARVRVRVRARHPCATPPCHPTLSQTCTDLEHRVSVVDALRLLLVRQQPEHRHGRTASAASALRAKRLTKRCARALPHAERLLLRPSAARAALAHRLHPL